MITEFERLRIALKGHYLVERELGAGGMATVYLAEDLKHYPQVAIKVLKQELAASLGVERFMREIEHAVSSTIHISCHCMIPARPTTSSTT